MNINRRSLLAMAAAMGVPGLAEAASVGGKAVEVPFRVTFNRAWAGVTIEGKDPLAFMIDTGTDGFWITPEAAARQGLKPLATGLAQSLVGRKDVAIYHANELIVGGGSRQRDIYLAGVSLRGDPLLSGIIPIPQFGAMGLDFDRQMLLIAPGLDGDPAGYDRLETTPGIDGSRSINNFGRYGSQEFAQNGFDVRPVIQATLDGQPLRLMVDTGSPDGLLLFSDYVWKQNLWDHYPKAVETGYSSVFQSARARLVRGEKLKIGRYGFQKPIIMLADPADRDKDGSHPIDGLIGMEIIRRFNVINHADRKALYIKPNAALGDGYRYDRAGIYIGEDRTGQVAVLWVAEGGPAARAGLKAGEKVTGWKGQGGFQGLTWALQGAPGATVTVEVERGGSRVLVPIVLEDVV